MKALDLIDTLVPKFRTVDSTLKQKKGTKVGLFSKIKKKEHALQASHIEDTNYQI